MPLPPLDTKKPTFTPAYGAEVRGDFYQGGEALPRQTIKGLTPTDIEHLRRAGGHNDPQSATQDFREKPAPSDKFVEETGFQVPKIGAREPKPYADPALEAPQTGEKPHTPASTPEQGRSRLPVELHDPFLVPDDEALRITPFVAKRLTDTLNHVLPSTAEYVAAAKAGEAKRGWYSSAARDLRSLFGTEAPRFIGVLAATSPKVPVEKNLLRSAVIWNKWLDWQNQRAQKGQGAPSRDDVMGFLEKLAKTDTGLFNLFTSWAPGTASALTDSDPGRQAYGVLNAPKTDSFRRNLLGDLNAVTNDVWMAHLGGYDQKIIAKLKGEYLANNVRIRQVAKTLNQDPQFKNNPWTPAEVQEAAWSFIRALAFIGGQSRNSDKTPLGPLDALKALTHETVAGNTDFVSLLTKPGRDGKENNVLRTLRQAGLGPAIDRLLKEAQRAKKGPARAVPTGPVTGSLTAADRQAIESPARRAARRVTSFSGPRGASRYRKRGTVRKYATGAEPRPPEGKGLNGTAKVPAASVEIPGNPPQQAELTSPVSEHSVGFSPNTDSGLSFEQAWGRVKSANQASFRKIAQGVLEQAGLKGQTHDAVGDWEGEAENSLYQHIPAPADYERVKYAAAWYGLLANQKAVLTFQSSPSGKDSLYTVDLPETDVARVRKSLDAAGIRDRTVIPQKNGTRVVYFDHGRALRDKVAQWAGAHNARVREAIGTGEYLGGPTRTAARAAYRRVIDAYESRARSSGSGSQAGPGQVPPQPEALRGNLHGSPQEGQKVKQARRGRPVQYATSSAAPGKDSSHLHNMLVDQAILRYLNADNHVWEDNVRKQVPLTPEGLQAAIRRLQGGFFNTHAGRIAQDVSGKVGKVSGQDVARRLAYLQENPSEVEYFFHPDEQKRQEALGRYQGWLNSSDYYAPGDKLRAATESLPPEDPRAKIAQAVRQGWYERMKEIPGIVAPAPKANTKAAGLAQAGLGKQGIKQARRDQLNRSLAGAQAATGAPGAEGLPESPLKKRARGLVLKYAKRGTDPLGQYLLRNGAKDWMERELEDADPKGFHPAYMVLGHRGKTSLSLPYFLNHLARGETDPKVAQLARKALAGHWPSLASLHQALQSSETAHKIPAPLPGLLKAAELPQAAQRLAAHRKAIQTGDPSEAGVNNSLGAKYARFESEEEIPQFEGSEGTDETRAPRRYSAIHSPAGGVIVRGQFYQGGKFIPKKELEKATWDQYQQVAAQRAKQYRRADGSWDVGASAKSPVKYAAGESTTAAVSSPQTLPHSKIHENARKFFKGRWDHLFNLRTLTAEDSHVGKKAREYLTKGDRPRLRELHDALHEASHSDHPQAKYYGQMAEHISARSESHQNPLRKYARPSVNQFMQMDKEDRQAELKKPPTLRQKPFIDYESPQYVEQVYPDPKTRPHPLLSNNIRLSSREGGIPGAYYVALKHLTKTEHPQAKALALQTWTEADPQAAGQLHDLLLEHPELHESAADAMHKHFDYLDGHFEGSDHFNPKNPTWLLRLRNLLRKYHQQINKEAGLE